MAEAFNTLAQLIYINDQNLADLDVTDLLEDAPLLQVILAVNSSNGTQHKYLKQTLTSSAAFRAVGAGLTKTPSQDTLVTDTLKILDGSFDCDLALADAFKAGRDAYLQRELIRTLKRQMFQVESQILLGTGNDAGGFAGLADDGQLDAVADTMVYNGGGTTADINTSVYLIRSGENDCAVVLGSDGDEAQGTIKVEDPVVIEKVVDPGTDNKTYPALYVAAEGYIGFQIGGAYSAARIANINGTDANASLDDDMLFEALALFPSGRQPTQIAMNRAAQKMLRASRTATNATGAPAPRPTEVEGIPIVVTDGITSTEAVLA